MNRLKFTKADAYKEKKPVGRKKYIILIIYDIVEDKRRTKMVKCLEGYGIRVQKSAFEAYLTKDHYQLLIMDASTIINTKTDSLRVYILPDTMSVKSWGISEQKHDEVIIC